MLQMAVSLWKTTSLQILSSAGSFFFLKGPTPLKINMEPGKWTPLSKPEIPFFVKKKPVTFFQVPARRLFRLVVPDNKGFGFGWFQTTKNPRGTAGSGGVPDPSPCADLSTITSQAGRKTNVAWLFIVKGGFFSVLERGEHVEVNTKHYLNNLGGVFLL